MVYVHEYLCNGGAFMNIHIMVCLFEYLCNGMFSWIFMYWYVFMNIYVMVCVMNIYAFVCVQSWYIHLNSVHYPTVEVWNKKWYIQCTLKKLLICAIFLKVMVYLCCHSNKLWSVQLFVDVIIADNKNQTEQWSSIYELPIMFSLVQTRLLRFSTDRWQYTQESRAYIQ